VFLPDVKGVVHIGEVEGEKVVARTGHVVQVFLGLARHVKLKTIAVEVAEVDNPSPLVVTTGLGDEEHGGIEAGVVRAFPRPACFEAWDFCV
jgi:hypothetical protein